MIYEQMLKYWEQEGIEPVPQYIVCAACKSGDTIIAGARHFDSVMQSQLTAIFGNGSSDGEARKQFFKTVEQGFIDQFGTFLQREEALKIAIENGQKINFDKNNSRVRLFSEGLYEL